MRLIYFVNTPRFFLSHWEPIALAARRTGYDVHVVCPDGDEIPTVRQHDWPVHIVRLGRSLAAPPREMHSIGQLALLYRRLKPDIVHHLSLKPIAYGGIAAQIAGVPAVTATVTGLGYAFSENGVRALCARTAVRSLLRVALQHRNQSMLFENEDDRNLFGDLGLSHPAKAALVPGAGVDCDRFFPSGEPVGSPLVILPGRMLWSKGVDVLVDAARILASRGVKARFALVGERDEGNPACVPVSWLTRQIDPVEYWGYQPDMTMVYGQASVVCLPSQREGMPKALAEACASGLPVVTTDVPGCRDAIENDVSGLLVPAGDSVATADALQKLILDPELRMRMGRNGRERAVQRFGTTRIVDIVLGTYACLLYQPFVETRTVRDGKGDRLSLSTETP